jgi:hypothetical protein
VIDFEYKENNLLMRGLEFVGGHQSLRVEASLFVCA